LQCAHTTVIVTTTATGAGLGWQNSEAYAHSLIHTPRFPHLDMFGRWAPLSFSFSSRPCAIALSLARITPPMAFIVAANDRNHRTSASECQSVNLDHT
jgi:hypothetical protein